MRCPGNAACRDAASLRFVLIQNARHLENAIGIVCDGTEGVHGENVAGRGQQSQTGKRDAVGGQQRIIGENGKREDQGQGDGDDAPDGTFQAIREAGNDHRCRTGAGVVGDFRHGFLFRGGEVFRQPADHERENDADARTEEEPPPFDHDMSC